MKLHKPSSLPTLPTAAEDTSISYNPFSADLLDMVEKPVGSIPTLNDPRIMRPFINFCTDSMENLAVKNESAFSAQSDFARLDPIFILKHLSKAENFCPNWKSLESHYLQLQQGQKLADNLQPRVEQQQCNITDHCVNLPPVMEETYNKEDSQSQNQEHLNLVSLQTNSSYSYSGVLNETGAASNSSSGEKLRSRRPKKKRAKTCKTSEEVESQRQTHIAVERNRRKQTNEQLKILRSLMPESYVQRNDQASIVGATVGFLKELEQTLECLESEKRRRLYLEGLWIEEDSAHILALPAVSSELDDHLLLQPRENLDCVPYLKRLHEDIAVLQSSIAEIEVKLVLNTDAFIKILCERRSDGQLLRTMAALERLHFVILHANITTIEQTVLYSFIVKINAETKLTAEGIATLMEKVMGHIYTIC